MSTFYFCNLYIFVIYMHMSKSNIFNFEAIKVKTQKSNFYIKIIKIKLNNYNFIYNKNTLKSYIYVIHTGILIDIFLT